MRMTIAVLCALAVSASFCAALYAAEELKAEGAPAAAGEGKPDQQTQVIPKKVAVDTVGDGKPHRFEHYDAKGQITRLEFDKVGDGVIDEAIIYENGKPVKGWKDTKRSGKPDVWIEYQ